MENWSIGKTISGCQVFQEPSLSNASICDQAVLPKLHHSSTPLLHKPLKFQETKSPLGMTKAGSSGPGFLREPMADPFLFLNKTQGPETSSCFGSVSCVLHLPGRHVCLFMWTYMAQSIYNFFHNPRNLKAQPLEMLL